jgi:hypothetical protein
MKSVLILIAATLGLVACGEQPQAMETSRRDSAAYTGTGLGFNASGWKAGDQKSWEAQLKARGQYGQNDHTRMH